MDINGARYRILDQHRRTPNVQIERQIEVAAGWNRFSTRSPFAGRASEVRYVLTSLSVEEHALPKAIPGRALPGKSESRRTRSDIHVCQFIRL